MFCGNCFRETQETGVCPWCGHDMAGAQAKYPLALKAGSILNGRYIVGRVLGQGGFGITYLAFDDKTHSYVAIKEYLPSEFASRASGASFVSLLSGNMQENYEYGKQLFLEEAKTLASFRGDEHIVRVFNYFEENRTAYFAMEYVEGETLDKYMKRHGGILTPEETDELLLPLMEALEEVHAKGIVHRDIAPDNIIVQPNGKAKLIDFGAARYSTGEKSKSLDVVIKHGFAPYEQYLRRGRQGPFTDVYAMAATYYFAITGVVPPESVVRLQEDTLVRPSNIGIQISQQAENALLKAMEVALPIRFQTMDEFRSALTGTGTGTIGTEGQGASAAGKPTPQEGRRETAQTQEQTKKRSVPKWLYALIPVALLAVILPIVLKGGHGAKETAEPAPIVTTESTVIPEPENTPVAVPEPAEEEKTEELAYMKDFSAANVGDTVTFGSYEQDNSPSNGKEPIEWIVLDKTDDRILVISYYALDCQRYNGEYTITAWDTSDLRKWLNKDFLNEAFTEEERACIPALTVNAEKNPLYTDIEPGKDTQDQVFLLSHSEAKKLFSSDKARRCIPTAYAKAQGCFTQLNYCRWWLRTLGYDSNRAINIDNEGAIYIYGSLVIYDNYGIRPAVWIATGH